MSAISQFRSRSGIVASKTCPLQFVFYRFLKNTPTRFLQRPNCTKNFVRLIMHQDDLPFALYWLTFREFLFYILDRLITAAEKHCLILKSSLKKTILSIR